MVSFPAATRPIYRKLLNAFARSECPNDHDPPPMQFVTLTTNDAGSAAPPRDARYSGDRPSLPAFENRKKVETGAVGQGSRHRHHAFIDRSHPNVTTRLKRL